MASPKVSINFFKMFSVIALLEKQLSIAMADGKISGEEAKTLGLAVVEGLCEMLDLTIE